MRKNNLTLVKPCFTKDESGSTAPIFALMLVPMIAMIGLAVDFSRAEDQQVRMQRSLDSAVLAAANETTDTAKINRAVAFFHSNFSHSANTTAVTFTTKSNGDKVGTASTTSSLAPATVSFTADSTGHLKGKATSTLRMPFAGLAQLSTVDVDVNATSAPGSNQKHNVEVAMMVDLTGSMGATRNGSTKISGLVTAGKDILDILLPASGVNNSAVKVGIAPMADYVNAGPYAGTATGLSTTGSYANLTNLKNTKQGPFSGSYSGLTGGSAGSQAGATSASSGTAGATFTSGHCDVTTFVVTAGTTATFQSKGGDVFPMGVQLDVEGSTPPPNVIVHASGSSFSNRIREVEAWKNNTWKTDDNKDEDWWLKIPTSTAGLTWRTDGTNKIGIRVNIEGSNSTFDGALVEATNSNPIRSINRWRNGAWQYDGVAKTNGRFMLIPEAWTTVATTATKPECTTAAQPSGQLVTCVTERTGSHAYDDESPAAGGNVGPYNKTTSGSTNKVNYSSDGKCYVAGRELPAVIPLTNSKSTLTAFFNAATVGGATPGHLGHAWAWYMLSPNWSSVWPSASQAAAYTDTNTKKYAIIMTDGEYNVHYASATAKAQALELCTGMKAKGITVYTVGFGFDPAAVAGANTVDGQAKQMLKDCASSSSTFFVPYDGAELRTAFQSIGNAIVTANTSSSTSSTVTN